MNISATTLVEGTLHPSNCSGLCVDGVVQRGNITKLSIGDESFANKISLDRSYAQPRWNAPSQGDGSIQDAVMASGDHVVNVTREVIGKYGVVSWLIRFVYNAEQYPTGTGDVKPINVTQAAATDKVVYDLTVIEKIGRAHV